MSEVCAVEGCERAADTTAGNVKCCLVCGIEAAAGTHLATCRQRHERPRPRLNTQDRVVFDHADDWHVEQGHEGDVRECAPCREASPYRVGLRTFFPLP